MNEPWEPPERQMKVTMMLCDHAQVAEGKMNLIGGGWAITGPAPMPFGIALIIDVPWHLTNSKHTFRLELIDLDGQAVVPPGADGPVAIDGEFEVGRPPGARPGVSLPFMAAMNSGPLPLDPGQHFEWRLTVNGQADEDWRLAFSTRPAVQSQAA